MWDFIKKLTKKTSQEPAASRAPHPAAPFQAQQSAPIIPPASREPQAVPRTQHPAPPAPPPAEKPHAQKTDAELAEELNKISPGILSQAKNPQMRKLVIDIYRRMLVEGVDVNNEKEVQKWLKRNPAATGGAAGPKVETVKRDAPKVGRNDPCVCGSGKKYKKCCG